MTNAADLLEEPERDLTPLIDIVFLLLIFFMCATKFVVPEGMLEAFLPKNRGGQTTTPVALQDVRVKLLWVEGSVVLEVGDQPFNRPGELEQGDMELSTVWPALYEQLKQLQVMRAGKPLPVIIDVRRQVPTKYAISTLNEVVRAGIREVTFAAPERG